MVYADEQFNYSGKIATDSNFWKQPVDRFVSGDTIIPKFSRVIAEQFFMPIKTPVTPMYQRIVGGSVKAGFGVTERMVCKTPTKHFKAKGNVKVTKHHYFPNEQKYITLGEEL